MLQIRNLTYSIGERVLLQQVQWNIHSGKRVALIGPNGAGKTTLLRLITRELTPDTGTITSPGRYQIGYLPQEERSEGRGRIFNVVKEGRSDLIELEKKIKALHHELSSESVSEEGLLARSGDLEHQFQVSGGYDLDIKIKTILSGLGFSETDFDRDMSEFSGGWRMRVYLARILVQQPDLLLLDEPTNHLDLPALEWLENYLIQFAGSVVVVSHDRYFIDRIGDMIAELDRGALTFYPAKYHEYEREKEERSILLLKQAEENRRERERIQVFIDRFRYKATKAAQVQSRIKQLEKMEQVEIPQSARKIRFSINVETPSYKHVLSLKDLAFRYETDWILEHINLDVYRGQNLALVGINGAGKTTLTRLISRELIPQEGSLMLGTRVKIGYYAQHQTDSLQPDKTVFEEVADTAAQSRVQEIRDVLGMFQFSGEDIQKPIHVLSGGEKARVSLVKILLSQANFLIMDEPTNHLDMASIEALEKALAEYDGTLMLISHDRYFLDKLVNRVIEIDSGRISEFEGNYSEYLDKREAGSEPDQQQGKNKVVPEKEPDQQGRKTKEQKRIEAEARQKSSKTRNLLQREISKLEKEIARLEEEKSRTENLLADPSTYESTEKVQTLKKEHARFIQELSEQYEAWEIKQSELEALVN